MNERFRVLVVDDEPDARAGTCDLIRTDPEFELIGECGDGVTAAETMLDELPDIVVLDIQMPDLDGFGSLELVDPMLRPEIVFLTAYEEHARRAFDVNAADYVLKPFSDERLMRALGKARDRARARRNANLYLQRLAVRTGSSVVVIPVEEIDWIEGADYYSRLHCGKRTHLIRQPLKQLERQLDPAQFIRVHRSAIANGSRIRRVVPYADLGIVLTTGAEIPLSRRLRPRVESYLRSRGSGAF